MAALSVEMEDFDSARYGKVHAAGCRDLRDEMPLAEVDSPTALLDAFNDATGWDYSLEDLTLSPCARKFFVQARYM